MSGLLGKVAVTASSNTIAYTVPDNKLATVSMNILNMTSTQAKIRMSIGINTTPNTDDYIEYNTIIPAYSVLERTGIVCSPSEKVIIYSDSAGVVARIYGFEETI